MPPDGRRSFPTSSRRDAGVRHDSPGRVLWRMRWQSTHGHARPSRAVSRAPVAGPHLFDLPQPELRVPLARQGPADKEPPLDRRRAGVVEFVGLPGDAVHLARRDGLLQRCSSRVISASRSVNALIMTSVGLPQRVALPECAL
jgi:hypothetical protein